MDAVYVAQDVFSGQPFILSFSGETFDLSPTTERAGELYVSPGWIDLQVNGFDGYDVNAPLLSLDSVRHINQRLWQEGVSAWCPTLVTAPFEQTQNSLRVLARAYEEDPWVAACLAGIHLEGPYISPLDGARGAHPLGPIRPPDWAEFTRWQEAAGGRIRIVTLAPELPGAIEFIAQLVRHGVIAALGHTHATSACIQAAVEAGAVLSTHLGNGIEASLPRHPNPIWDQLAEERLVASFIFDGFHLPANVMKVFCKVKGPQGCLLVSDASNLAGLAPGVYETPVGGKVELHLNGKLSLYGTEYLAGSASSLVQGVENAVRLAGCSLVEAVRMVTLNPAHLLSFEQTANTIFALDHATGQVAIVATCINGKVVYRNPDWPG